MKLTMHRIEQGEEEVIIRYREMNGQIQAIARMVSGKEGRVKACGEEGYFFIAPEEIFYLESVDGNTFAYLEKKVLRIQEGLGEMALCYEDKGFFRCSKSMVINIFRIRYLKSEPGSRIRATMENGEQVMISRRYAKQLRRVLKGEAEDEE